MVLPRVASLVLAASVFGLPLQSGHAQTYPNQNVRVVVPYPAGGSVDGVARIITQKLNETLGAHFIVDNRGGGAGGSIGANYVAKATPDGTTLLLTASIHVITPLLNKNIPYDVVKDFTPISLIASGPLLVSTSPQTPAKNLSELFDLVRKNPGKFTFATSGFGSAGHLAVEMLKHKAGVDTVVMAYTGAAPALTDLMAGRVLLMADPMLSSLPLAQGGQIKALAITSATRTSIAPEVPTVAEAGMSGTEFASWYGLWGPAKLPSDIASKLETTIEKIVAMPDVKQRLATLGFEGVGSTQDYFAKFIVSEIEKSAKIIKDANIKTE